MPDLADYKEPYLLLMRAVEASIRILEEAQLQCEELIIRDENDPPPSF